MSNYCSFEAVYHAHLQPGCVSQICSSFAVPCYAPLQYSILIRLPSRTCHSPSCRLRWWKILTFKVLETFSNSEIQQIFYYIHSYIWCECCPANTWSQSKRKQGDEWWHLYLNTITIIRENSIYWIKQFRTVVLPIYHIWHCDR